MTKQIINIGSGELAGDGESIRSAFSKINANFNEVYNFPSTTGDIGFTGTSIYSLLGLSISNDDLQHGWTAIVSVPPYGDTVTPINIQDRKSVV